MVTALALTLSLVGAPPAMTREQIIDRASPAVGYSYWWGGACWQADGGGGHGSCSGNCPDCTHSGSHGADCSGFVFKAWQIDGAEAVSHCGHGPYTANSYHSSETHWTHIARGDAKKADILASTTHVVILQSGDPWGTPTVMEARGCSYGVQRNTRSFGSTYNASRRDNLTAPTPTYKATFVAQSFPYSEAPAIVLREGETLDGSIDLRNDGTAPWNSETKLAPTPRDQPSVLADPSWLTTTRITSPGSVAPGQLGHFAFRIRGGAPGEHIQTFGLVQEAVTWFAQQGGPPDTQLAIRVRVLPRDHAGTLVGDTFARDAGGVVVVPLGATLQGSVDIRNDGHVAWDGTVRLAPVPRDQPSSVAAPSWLSTNRVASPDAATAEGSVARFTFEIGGNSLGETEQAFGLVHDGVTWFEDAGYGPADGFFRIRVRVVEPAPGGAGSTDNLASAGADLESSPQADEAAAADGDASREGRYAFASTATGGCAQGGGPAPGLLTLALLLVLRRRR